MNICPHCGGVPPAHTQSCLDYHYQKAQSFVAEWKMPDYENNAAAFAALKAIGMGADAKKTIERLRNGSFDDYTLEDTFGDNPGFKEFASEPSVITPSFFEDFLKGIDATDINPL